MFPHPGPYNFAHVTSLQPNLHLNLRLWSLKNFYFGIIFLSLRKLEAIQPFEVEITKFLSTVFPTHTKSSH